MKYLNNYADQRSNGRCVYCGGAPETREHVPSKIFLDRPFPESLSIVKACATCNHGFSIDEEYMACLLDCIISGTANPDLLQRKKIKQTLKKNPALAQRLQNALTTQNNRTIFDVELDRIKTVVQKIATGHVLYELNLPIYETPEVLFYPFEQLSDYEIERFEDINFKTVDKCPEVGSRSMQRLIVAENNVYHEGWVIVQPDRYRYAVTQTELVEVRMVFSEYLACHVIWSNR